MNTEAVEREFLEMLRRTCRTMRTSRNRPELAIPAAAWEMKINIRLAELDGEQMHREPEASKAVAA